MNLTIALKVLNDLFVHGVREVIVCAGARNAPFVHLLGQGLAKVESFDFLKDFKVHHFYEERAAGFFALGVAKKRNRPVAVITTSGTAAAELLPAAIESYYSGTPLVFITADRPKNYRGKAAPQSIEQVGLFGVYSHVNYDFDDCCEIEVSHLDRRAVTHINVCFSEPLLDTWPNNMSLTRVHQTEDAQSKAIGNESLAKGSESRDRLNLKSFFDRTQKPLVILGGIRPENRSSIAEFLSGFGCPVWAEAQSGLRESDLIKSQILRLPDGELNSVFFKENFDSVLRIGSVPTVRLWRDLDGSLSHVPVLSVHDLMFSGLARETTSAIHYEVFFNFVQNEKLMNFLGAKRCQDNEMSHFESGHHNINPYEVVDGYKEFHESFFGDQSRSVQTLLNALEKYPESEPSFFRRLSEQIPAGSFIFLGNSLPIREWDLAATFQNKQFEIASNRGANGIDGLISTFLGMCEKNRENWLVLGDLSALYDLNALSLLAAAESPVIRIVVVNNGGGQIFKRMFNDSNFLNQHALRFEHWAKMFHFEYVEVKNSTWPKLSDHPTVIEILPDPNQTDLFWQNLNRAGHR